MAIAFNSSGSASYNGVGSTLTWTQNITDNTNSIIIVSTFTDGTQNWTNIAYAGTNLTRIISGTESTAVSSDLWYLLSPPSGLGTFKGTTSGAFNAAAVSIALTGVSQTTSILGSTSGTGVATSGSLSLTTTNETNWVVGGFAINKALGTSDSTTGQVERAVGSNSAGFETRLSTNGPIVPVGVSKIRYTFANSSFASSMAEVKAIPGTIQFDAAGSSTVAGSVFSYSHTCTGNNRILFVSSINGGLGVGSIVGLTYNNVALTKIKSGTESFLVIENELWYLVNPPTGANTIAGTWTGNTPSVAVTSLSLTGVDQTTPIQGSALLLGTTVTSGSLSLTTVNDNDWIVGNFGIGATGTVDTTNGGVQRAVGTISSAHSHMVTNGPISPAGLGTVRYTSSSTSAVSIIADVKPFTAAVASSGPVGWKTLFGVGQG